MNNTERTRRLLHQKNAFLPGCQKPITVHPPTTIDRDNVNVRQQRGHDSRFPDSGGVWRRERDGGLHRAEVADQASRRRVDPAHLRGLRRRGAPFGHRPGLVKVRSGAGRAKNQGRLEVQA